jgi:serine/threonine protein kinase
MANVTLLELSQSDRNTLESWLVAFDTAWQEDALATWVRDKLPGRESPLRAPALIEMIKVDLERQWQHGRRLSLASYLERYPELGTFETIPADLILAEYEVRKQFNVPAEASAYLRRFPRQAGELAELIRQAEAEASEPPGPAGRETSRPGQTCAPTGAPLAIRELPEQFGRYRILKKLGQGGMGAVYLAHDAQLDREVALKVPHFSANEAREVLDRFLREARAAATVQHPNLCPVYDVGEIGGIHYMTMAYIEGHPLSKYIRAGKPAPERQTAAVIRKVALGLDAAHKRGVVHRDIKPANILIDSRGEPVVTDFGLARRTQREDVVLTQAGAVLGTPAYMSPEQVRGRGEAVGPASDIFSLGVVLYELLTSHRPFPGDNALEVAAQIATAQPIPPQQHRPELHPRLEAICLKALAKRPEDRYATMADLAAALTDFLQAVPRSMALPSRARRSRSPAPNDSATRPPDAEEKAYGVSPAADAPADHDDADKSLGLTEALSGLSGFFREMDPDSQPASGAAAAAPVHQSERLESHPPPLPAARDRSPRARRVPAALRRVPRGLWIAAGFAALRHVSRGLWIAAGFAAAAVLFGVILFVPSRYGTVKIEVSDPRALVEVKIDGEQIDIAGLRPLRLRAGEHGIVVTSADFETVTQRFTVKRGTEEPLCITLIPKPAIATSSPHAPREEKHAATGPGPLQPAVYRVALEPADATLSVSGAGATVARDGAQWTVTVSQPDGKQKITLLATKSGYYNEERELQPAPGELRDLSLRLRALPLPPKEPVARPAVYTVKITPADTRLVVSGAGATVTGEGLQRTVTVAQPDGKQKITLLATKSGYQDEERELQPRPGESRELVLHLRPLLAPSPPEEPKGEGLVQWRAGDGANGHWYRAVVVPESITWGDAKAAAEKAGGYLATISSAAENAFVYQLASKNPGLWHMNPWNDRLGPWLGGHQTAAGWRWVTGERWDYTNWAPGEPNSTAAAVQDKLMFFGGRRLTGPQWADGRDSDAITGYIVEYDHEPVTPPARKQ